MPSVALTTFLKLYSMTPSQKAAALQKYLEAKGGYDFYRRLKTEAHRRTVEGKSFLDCEAEIKKAKKEEEREHNLTGLQNLDKWLAANGSEAVFFVPPHARCATNKNYFKIKLEPEFGIQQRGKRRIVTVWNSKKPAMTQSIAGVGLYLMQEHLVQNSFENCQPAILDLRTNNLFVADVLPADMPAKVSAQFAWIDWFFESRDDTATGSLGASPPPPL